MSDLEKAKESAVDQLLDEVAEWIGIVEPIQDDEFTVAMLLAKTGIPESTLRGRLAKQVAQGRLAHRWTIVDGCRTRVYRRNGNKNSDISK